MGRMLVAQEGTWRS